MRSLSQLCLDLYHRLTAEGSIEEQAVRGGIWVAGLNIGGRVLQLLKIVIFARLLSAQAFGLFGISLLVLIGLKRFSRLGLDEALIQHSDDNVDAYLNTAWIIKAARGAVVAAVAFALAPFIADFFSEPQVEPLTRAIGISPLLLGLQNPAVVYFNKNLDFNKEFVYQIGGRVVDFIVAITFVLLFRSVWALIIGIISMNLSKLIMSYYLHPYRPNFSFDLNRGKEMFTFGKWMFAMAVLSFLYGEGDDSFVGWFFTAATLGYYRIAYRFANAPATEVTHVISRVAFPTFSKIQDDTEDLRNGYFRVVQLSTIISFPMAGGIIAIAPQFVPVVFGTQWEPMVPLMQVLALLGALEAFGANVGALFKAIGRPDYDVWLQALKVVLIAVSIYFAADYFGPIGVAYVVIGSSLAIQPILIYLVLSLIDGDLTELLWRVGYPLVSSICMCAIVTGIDTYVLARAGVLEIAFLIVAGATSYLIFMIIIEKQTGYEFIRMYQTLQQSI